MKYDFDEYVSREKTDSLTVDGWREYLFAGQSELHAVSGRRANQPLGC